MWPWPLSNTLFKLFPSLCPLLRKQPSRRSFRIVSFFLILYFVHKIAREVRKCRKIDAAAPDETDLVGDCTLLPCQNLSPLITLPCLLLLGDEIASQKADCYSDQKDYEQIVFQILVPSAHYAGYLISMSIARMIFGRELLGS
jgi:hypothetical protein